MVVACLAMAETTVETGVDLWVEDIETAADIPG